MLTLLLQVTEAAHHAVQAVKPGFSLTADDAFSDFMKLAVSAGIGFLIKSIFTKPREKLEQFEEAKLKSLEDSVTKQENVFIQARTDYLLWKERNDQRLMKLELEQDSLSKALQAIREDSSKTITILSEMQKTLAVMSYRIEHPSK